MAHTLLLVCVCARSERNGQVYVAPCHIRETPALFFLHFFFIRCVLNVLFFSSWISTQVSELYFRSMRSVDLFFVVIIELSKIRTISFRFEFEDHYNVWKQQIYLVADDVQSKSSKLKRSESTHRSPVCTHAAMIQMPHVFGVLSTQMGSRTRKSNVCDVIR